jgi:hypothetical protein
MEMPNRVQLSRRKGFKLPLNTVSVERQATGERRKHENSNYLK